MRLRDMNPGEALRSTSAQPARHTAAYTPESPLAARRIVPSACVGSGSMKSWRSFSMMSAPFSAMNRISGTSASMSRRSA